MTETPGRTEGETHGPEQEPTAAGEQDPAHRDPRPDGPMNQPADEADANDSFAERPDAAYGQRESQADMETGQRRP